MSWTLYTDYPHMDQRRPLWAAVQAVTDAKRVLYPGSFTDVSPSFVFDHVTYMDMDRRCPGFFADPDVAKRLPHGFDFIHGDYQKPFQLKPVDLLISQFAGPISHHCDHHVRPGGYLLANNSHADAGVAALDPAWDLVGIARGDRIVTTSLENYFRPKRAPAPTQAELIASQKGVEYTKTAPNYLFQRT